MSEVLTGEVVDDGNESHLTLELVEKAIWLSRGNRARAARRLGITRQAVNGWQIRHPHLRTLAAEARESLVDLALDNLERALVKREQWATELTLLTLGKGIGFTRRMELTPTTPLPITVSDSDYAMA